MHTLGGDTSNHGPSRIEWLMLVLIAAAIVGLFSVLELWTERIQSERAARPATVTVTCPRPAPLELVVVVISHDPNHKKSPCITVTGRFYEASPDRARAARELRDKRAQA